MLEGINGRNILTTVAVLPGITIRERPWHNSILGHAHIVRFIRDHYFHHGRGLGRGTLESLPVPLWALKNLATMQYQTIQHSYMIYFYTYQPTLPEAGVSNFAYVDAGFVLQFFPVLILSCVSMRMRARSYRYAM